MQPWYFIYTIQRVLSDAREHIGIKVISWVGRLFLGIRYFAPSSFVPGLRCIYDSFHA
jgi:hypothetical protein